MSDYPMLISNKLHSFRNFPEQRYKNLPFYIFSISLDDFVGKFFVFREKD